MPQRGGFFRSLPIPQMVVEQHVYDSEQEALVRDEEFHDALDSMSDSDNGDCAADGDASDMALHAQLANDEVFFDPAMGAAMPEFQVIDMHNGSDEWLTEALLDDGQEAGVIQVIEVRDAAHAAEVVVVMPCYDVTNRIFGAEARLLHDAEHQQAARLNPFAMLTFKRIDFADGPVMCSCCENPGCNRSDTSREVFAYLFQAPDQQHQVQESVLVDHEPLCRCASAVIDARFGTLGTSDEEVCSDSSFWSFYTQAEPYSAPLTCKRFCVCTLSCFQFDIEMICCCVACCLRASDPYLSSRIRSDAFASACISRQASSDQLRPCRCKGGACQLQEHRLLRRVHV